MSAVTVRQTGLVHFEQEKAEVCTMYLGTLHNCCKNPEVLAIVKRIGIVQHVLPFLREEKLGRGTLLLSKYEVLPLTVSDIDTAAHTDTRTDTHWHIH